MRTSLLTTTTCLTTVVLLAGATAWADFTLVSPPPRNEASITQIFESFYSPGTTWQATGTRLDSNGASVDLTNGNLLATRVDDSGFPGILDAAAPYFGSAEDQRWSGQEFSFDAVARYAGYTQQFGYDLLGSNTGYTKLFDITGSGMNVSGSGTLTLQPGQSVAWRRTGGDGGMYSSNVVHNADGYDHMIAYRITGYNDDLARWMLFWEDKPAGGDKDYNDLAVQVSTRCVPEPGMGVTIFLVCGAYWVLRRRDW